MRLPRQRLRPPSRWQVATPRADSHPDARRLLQRIPAFVPHPRIAAHARELGFHAVATDGADAGLIAGLLEWFASHPIQTH